MICQRLVETVSLRVMLLTKTMVVVQLRGLNPVSLQREDLLAALKTDRSPSSVNKIVVLVSYRNRTHSRRHPLVEVEAVTRGRRKRRICHMPLPMEMEMRVAVDLARGTEEVERKIRIEFIKIIVVPGVLLHDNNMFMCYMGRANLC